MRGCGEEDPNKANNGVDGNGHGLEVGATVTLPGADWWFNGIR